MSIGGREGVSVCTPVGGGEGIMFQFQIIVYFFMDSCFPLQEHAVCQS